MTCRSYSVSAKRVVLTGGGYPAEIRGDGDVVDLRRLVIADESFDRVPVTVVPQTGLEEKADGLIPGTLFDSIYFDHESGFVVLNPNDGD